LIRKRFGLKPERAFEEAVLRLQMLRAKESTLHPYDRLQLLHENSQ
jgi:hypothetical protein